MNTTNRMQKGFVFSFDLMIAFIAVLSASFIAISLISSNIEKQASFIEENELKTHAIFLADSIVKNSDENNSFYGMALFDSEKHRVKSNEISPKFIEKEPPLSGKFFIREISAEFKNGVVKKIFEKNLEGKNCIAIERFVLLEGKKAKLNLAVCSE